MRVRHPEAAYNVSVTSDDVIVCVDPDDRKTRLPIGELQAVFVETNDSGPWGADVWWILQNTSGNTELAFPQLATGEDAVLDRLRQLPGFQIDGMNSASNARFLCWQRS